MNRSFLLVTVAVGLAVAVGCGMPMTPADPVAYQQLAMDLTAKVQTHRTLAGDAGTVGDCTAEHSRYDAEVRPMVERMKAQSGGMDSCMTKMGKAADADMAANCGSMMSEMDQHRTAACGSDVAAAKTETTRHCDAMKTWLDSENSRATYLKGGMGGMGDGCK